MNMKILSLIQRWNCHSKRQIHLLILNIYTYNLAGIWKHRMLLFDDDENWEELYIVSIENFLWIHVSMWSFVEMLSHEKFHLIVSNSKYRKKKQNFFFYFLWYLQASAIEWNNCLFCIASSNKYSFWRPSYPILP